MTDNNRNFRKELDNISMAYEELLLGMTDKEIEAEVVADGENPQTIVDGIQLMMKKTVKSFRKQKLEKARITYDKKSSESSWDVSKLGLSRKQKEDLLLNIISANPLIGNALTIQHREFNKLSESDLDDILGDLDALNMLNKIDDGSN